MSSSVSAPMRRVLVVGALASLLLIPLAVGLGFLITGADGAWGAMLGLAIPGVFLLMTAVIVWATADSGPGTLGAVLLGSWLIKIIVLIGVLALIQDATWYSKAAFFAAFSFGTILYLALEATVVLRAKVPYVETQP